MIKNIRKVYEDALYNKKMIEMYKSTFHVFKYYTNLKNYKKNINYLVNIVDDHDSYLIARFISFSCLKGLGELESINIVININDSFFKNYNNFYLQALIYKFKNEDISKLYNF